MIFVFKGEVTKVQWQGTNMSASVHRLPKTKVRGLKNSPLSSPSDQSRNLCSLSTRVKTVHLVYSKIFPNRITLEFSRPIQEFSLQPPRSVDECENSPPRLQYDFAESCYSGFFFITSAVDRMETVHLVYRTIFKSWNIRSLHAVSEVLWLNFF